ncbi:MAG TPA: polysaccharide deacetylase family protein [Chitinophagaceae bacterium]|nr:polysaccharide deacetylase family protein [Chitinophagaceae bacterium]
MKETILKHYPGLALKDPTFRVIFTYDIDTAFAFRGRDLLRQFASSAKDMAALDLDRLKQRIQVLSGMTRDPSDTYDYLMGSWGTVPAEIIFFILSGSYGRFDKNLSLDSRVMKQLVGHLEHHARIGLHPSYRSGDNYYRISKEKKRLESLVGRPIHISRQHYLRFRLPDTYRVLLQAGLTAEYSMGYADLPGFRAGTSLPFYFYDLGLEKKTSLQIFPITFMEGSLKDYMKLSPDQAWPVVSGLIAEVKHSGGVFMSLWHNDSLSDTGTWKGWRELHDRMIRQINSIL